MGDQTKSSKTDWGNLEAYLSGDCAADLSAQSPPKIITEGMFHFTEELIDQEGESIEPEVSEDTFIDWLESSETSRCQCILLYSESAVFIGRLCRCARMARL